MFINFHNFNNSLGVFYRTVDDIPLIISTLHLYLPNFVSFTVYIIVFALSKPGRWGQRKLHLDTYKTPEEN